MIGPAGCMAAPTSVQQDTPPIWDVEWASTYRGRIYWVVWRRQAGVYGGRAYMLTPRGSDRRRFYDQASAEKAAAKLNSAAIRAAQEGESNV